MPQEPFGVQKNHRNVHCVDIHKIRQEFYFQKGFIKQDNLRKKLKTIDASIERIFY